MFHRFEFESEFYSNLERIPFHVRMKLDLTGVKLSLNTWRAFRLEERQVLCHLPIGMDEERNVFISYLTWLSSARASVAIEQVPVVEPSTWGNTKVPETVRSRSDDHARPITDNDWRRWAEHERYALYKTAASKDPSLFDEALGEMLRRVRGKG